MTSATVFPKDTDSIELNQVRFTFHDIKTTIGLFYAEVETDEVLKVPFQSVHDWPHHVERLVHFWWIRFGGEPYLDALYNPVEKHFHAGFNETFLLRWISLFQNTLKKVLTPEQTQLWGMVVERMGHSLSMRNDFLKQSYK